MVDLDDQVLPETGVYGYGSRCWFSPCCQVQARYNEILVALEEPCALHFEVLLNQPKRNYLDRVFHICYFFFVSAVMAMTSNLIEMASNLEAMASTGGFCQSSSCSIHAMIHHLLHSSVCFKPTR